MELKIQRDNQNSFPATKVISPLIEILAESEDRTRLKNKKITDAQRAALLDAALHHSDLVSTSRTKTEKRLTQMLRFGREIRATFEPFAAESVSVAALFSTITKCELDAGLFLTELAEQTIEAVRRGEAQQRGQQGRCWRSNRARRRRSGVMMEAAPASAFVVAESEFLL